jgi:hypothetical protein
MTSNNDDSSNEPLDRLPHEGFSASWTSVHSADIEELTINFENEGWTVQGIISGIDVHYVIRLSALWKVQQMLLFRDLDDPDLWLANDGSGQWGEVNGSQRRELGGCEDVDICCSAFTGVLAIRRLDLDIGGKKSVDSVVVDPDSLAITRSRISYSRETTRTWSVERDDSPPRRFDVDSFGLPFDIPGIFKRTS